MSRVEKTVFLSYRRTDMAWSRLVFEHLQRGGFDVFVDYTGISSGSFAQVILENVRARAHFLVLLTPTALNRCNEPGDWVRREIETALEHKRNIVPLLLPGFSFDAPAVATQLTGRLAQLKEYNGLEVPIQYFDVVMERLQQDYLSRPIDTVLHPLSAQAATITKNTITAASTSQATADIEARMTVMERRVLNIVRDAGTAAIALTVTPQEEAEMRPLFNRYGKAVTFRHPDEAPFPNRPTQQDVPGAGGRRTLTVSEARGKSWKATTDSDWILLGPDSSGAGFGRFTYQVLPNKGLARTGTIRVAGVTHTVTQARGKWFGL